jgi:hypothetical protein
VPAAHFAMSVTCVHSLLIHFAMTPLPTNQAAYASANTILLHTLSHRLLCPNLPTPTPHPGPLTVSEEGLRSREYLRLHVEDLKQQVQRLKVIEHCIGHTFVLGVNRPTHAAGSLPSSHAP